MSKTIAIIGASTDRSKFGNKAVRAYVDDGWTVYPVNPKGGEIEGLQAYESIEAVPEGLNRVSMYVPPKVGLGMLDAIAEKNPAEVWFNPGSEDDAVLKAAKDKGLNPIDKCSIVAIGKSPSQYPDA
jgi:uncharacterized protein